MLESILGSPLRSTFVQVAFAKVAPLLIITKIIWIFDLVCTNLLMANPDEIGHLPSPSQIHFTDSGSDASDRNCSITQGEPRCLCDDATVNTTGERDRTRIQFQ